jgi:hypothetical protein
VSAVGHKPSDVRTETDCLRDIEAFAVLDAAERGLQEGVQWMPFSDEIDELQRPAWQESTGRYWSALETVRKELQVVTERLMDDLRAGRVTARLDETIHGVKSSALTEGRRCE